MLSSVEYTDALSIRRPQLSSVIFTDTPSLILMKKFMFALNASGHLHYEVTIQQLKQVAYLQVASTYWGAFISGSTIKYRDGDVAEMGFMLVDKKYRRQGLAEHMTQSRINYAHHAGIKRLYAKV